MGVELLTDRSLIQHLLDASDGLDEEELVSFASMKERLEENDGLLLTGRQRIWAEEIFHRMKLVAVTPDDGRTRPKARKMPGNATPSTKPPPVCWWDGSDPRFHPLKPPPGNKPWNR